MGNTGFCVLVVDDSLIVVQRIISLLKEHEYIESVFSALNYRQAQDILSNNDVHIALLDINMPGQNGLDLLEYIKLKHPTVINIMLTNQSEAHYREICVRLGADHFLYKTSEFEKVPELIRGCYLA
jgi:DNA-binding NarL/FixJ family response regulator